MNTAAFYHRANDNYCYPLNENKLVICVKTGTDVSQVYLCHGDPFQSGIMGGSQQWSGTRTKMRWSDCRRLKEHLLWCIEVEPPFKRCRYYFEMHDNRTGEAVYLTESGVLTEEEFNHGLGRRLDYYFPWMNSADIYTAPSWVSDTVWYQIFPDRFCNGDTSNDPPQTCAWASPLQAVQNKEIYGGDLAGIISKLDYIKNLGIGGIYLTPVNKSSSIHKYDTDNYYKIDPQFGSNDDMKKMVQEAHRRQLRVMVDGVFNHCGVGLLQWQDVVLKGPDSIYFDWFMINEWPLSSTHHNAKEGRYYTFAFADNMPKLNTNHPAVIDEILKVCTYWVTEYDIDALRLDVANEISHLLCKELRKQMLLQKSDFYILGEIWHDSITWLRGDEFDSVMNYPLRDILGDIGVSAAMTSARFEQEINRCYSMYMKQMNPILFNLLDSHDTIRLATRLKNENLFYLQLAALFTMTGTCCIYYGTEISLEGEHDPDCRRCMPFAQIEAGTYDTAIGEIKKLIALRLSNKALRFGECTFPHHSYGEQLFYYRKSMSGEKCIDIFLNGGQTPIKLPQSNSTIYQRHWNSKQNLLAPFGILIRETAK